MQEELYPEFNLIINKQKGVSPVGEETKIIARYVAKVKPSSALDMGCGTGFIPIYLKTQGIDCEGADINENAINLATENAKTNNVSITLHHSDLFQNINKTYDCIIFNAPYGNVSSGTGSKMLEYVKSFIPKGTIITKITYLFIRKRRKALTRKFLEEAKPHLNENGKIILLMDPYELDLLKKYTTIEPFLGGKIVCIEGENL